MTYHDIVIKDLEAWHLEMLKKPSMFGKLTKGIQVNVNQRIPERFHTIITESIKNMVKAVLFGSEYTTKHRVHYSGLSLEEKDRLVKERLTFYKRTAALEGAGTGAGGIVLGLADFPLLLSLKIKFLFDIASIYGFDVKDYKERVFILQLFKLAFSSEVNRRDAYQAIYDWEQKKELLPNDINELDWKELQQEYRDYMDIAKLMQMIPVIGAAFGAYANYQLLEKLGKTAMNGYRLRLLQKL